MGPSAGPRRLVYLGRRLCRDTFMTTKFREFLVTMLSYRSLTKISGGTCCTSKIWLSFGRSVGFLTKCCGLT